MPDNAAGERGFVGVVGGGERRRRERSSASNLDELLRQMSAAPGNGAVEAVLGFGRRERVTDSATKEVSAPVSGSQFFDVRVRR